MNFLNMCENESKVFLQGNQKTI